MCLVSAMCSHAHYNFSSHTYNHPCAWYLLCARTLTTATHPIPITIHVLGICCVLARSLQQLVPYLYPSMCLVSAVSSLAHYSYSSHTYNHPCAWYLLCARTLTTATHPIPITIHVLDICCVLARSLQLLIPYL